MIRIVDDIVGLRLERYLIEVPLIPLGDLLFTHRCAASNAVKEGAPTSGFDVYGGELGLREKRLKPAGSLHLDISKQHCSPRKYLFDGGFERPIAVPAVLGPFEELPRLDAAIELLAREEVTVHAIDLARARSTGRAGNECREFRIRFLGSIDEGILPAPRWSDDDDEFSTLHRGECITKRNGPPPPPPPSPPQQTPRRPPSPYVG